MLEIIAENAQGTQLKFSEHTEYAVTKVTGINPPNANINTSELATMDGSIFNSAFLQNRNIVLTIYPQNDIESARIYLYGFFRTKKYIKLYFKNGARNVWIDGRVESIAVDPYSDKENLQISVICPNPWLKDVTATETTLSGSTTVKNNSDDEVGLVATVTVTGAAQGFTLANATNGQSFTVDYTFQSGDVLTLNTRRGEKRVSLLRSGNTVNLLNYIDLGSKWVSLEIGNNSLSFTATSGAGNMSCKVAVQTIYEGM